MRDDEHVAGPKGEARQHDDQAAPHDDQAAPEREGGSPALPGASVPVDQGQPPRPSREAVGVGAIGGAIGWL